MRSNFVLSAGVSAFALSLGWWSQGDDQITSGRVIAAESGPKNRPVSYSRDIKPILAVKCFACHGPDEGKRKAKLNLGEHDSAVTKAIKPGDAALSPLVQRIT